MRSEVTANRLSGNAARAAITPVYHRRMSGSEDEGGGAVAPRPRWFLRSTAFALGVIAVLLAATDVAHLSSHERDAFSEPRVAVDDGMLLSLRLDAEDWVRFEVCADRPVDAEFENLAFLVVRQEAHEQVFERRLDSETRDRVSEGRHGHCVVLGQSTDHGLPESGTYALVTRWDAPPPAAASETGIAGRIVTRRPLTWASRSAPLVALIAALLILFSALRAVREPRPGGELPSRPLLRAASAVSVLAAVIVVVPWLGPPSSLAVLARGLFFIALEVLLIRRFWPRARLLEHAEKKSTRVGWLVFAGGPVIGLVLVVLGRVVGAWIPTPDVAPIHDFVSIPSGTVAAALIGMLAPVAEEWFFRGFLFGLVAARTSNAIAWVATTVAFAIVHLPQHWGAWDASAALVVTGLGLGALRWWTGSFAASAVAHLTHNALLILPRLLA